MHHKRKPEKTRNLVTLLERCTKIDDALQDLDSECRTLTVYAVEARYPDDFHMPDAEEGRAADAAARRVRSRILALLPADEA